MKKLLFSTFTLFLLSFCSIASQVNEEKANKVAQAYYKSQTKNNNCIISDVYTERVNNISTFYVFSFSPKGFVIISADDNLKPILAYSFTGWFDKNNIPPHVKIWIEQYSGYIYDIIIQKKQSTINLASWENILSGNSKETKYIVTPLCTTTWDQGCYYNELCPADTLGPCDHSVTGCVATAMAMVMKFWNYPVKGNGTHSYTSYWYGIQTANFGITTYNWASMPDNVTATNPAVATLMYHCGVSVDMDYASTTSGSNLYFSKTALPTYFKYSNNIEFVYKLSYTDSSWIELLKSELNAGRPILYQGRIPTLPVGHAFVCDGYDSNNFFHFIWGQGAGYEGYYEMGNMIYNIANEAVIKIMPIVSCDVALRNYISPVSSTFITPSRIKVKISNYDSLPLSNIPVSYSIDGNTPVTETINTPLAALSDTVYEFIQPFDFTQNPGHFYNVKIYSSLSCDSYKNNDTISTIIENVACTPPPYSTGFEPSENLNGWLINDINNDGNKWNYGLGGNTLPTCVYYNGGSSQANDWIISKCIELENNKMYKLSYYYKGTATYWPQKLKIYIGSQQNIANLITLLTNDSNIINTEYLKKEIFFTVPASGSYYIGWNCYSDADMYNLAIDDINISEQIAINVGLVSTTLPNESCNLQQENIEVVIRNYCSSTLNNIPISFSLNGGTPVTEIITTPIPIGGILTYTFTNTIDLSVNGLHNVKIFTSLLNDTIFSNDTINVNITNHTSITPVYTMGFEPSDDFSGWKIYNNNNDAYKWNIINTGGRTQPYCIRYDYSSWLPAYDWFVSSCVSLSASQNYKVSFWYKAEASQWPEKLKVFIGSGQDTSSLNTLLLDLPNIINTNYQYAERIFTVPSDGLYYIGWDCYSDAVMFNLYIDDILIDVMTDIKESDKSEFTIFPNPCRNEVNIENNAITKKEVEYKILDISGKQITKINSNSNRVQVSTNNLSKGIYILKIKSDEGITVKKLIKE